MLCDCVTIELMLLDIVLYNTSRTCLTSFYGKYFHRHMYAGEVYMTKVICNMTSQLSHVQHMWSRLHSESISSYKCMP